MDTLHYVASPGEIKLGINDPLVNTEPTPIMIEGYAIPGHLDEDGHVVRAGFDIVRLSLTKQTEFVSAHSIVWAPSGQNLHWRQVPNALQWADDKAYEGFLPKIIESVWTRATTPLDIEVNK
jgi:hypothetical protein